MRLLYLQRWWLHVTCAPSPVQRNGFATTLLIKVLFQSVCSTSDEQSLARVLDPGTRTGPGKEPGEGTGDRPSPVAMVRLAPVLDYEGLVNGCVCSTTSVHFSKPANERPNVIIFTGGARYQFDNRGRDRRMIHRMEGWVDSLPPSIRHDNVRLHDLRELNDPHEGRSGLALASHRNPEKILNSRSGRHLLTLCFVDIEKVVAGHKPTTSCLSARRTATAALISAGPLRSWDGPFSWPSPC